MSQVNSFRGGSTSTGSSISPDDIKPLKFYRNGTLDEEYNPLAPDVTEVELSDGVVKVTYDPNIPDSASKAYTDIVLALTEGSIPILLVGNRFYPMVYASSAGYVFQLLVDNTIKKYTVSSGGVESSEQLIENAFVGIYGETSTADFQNAYSAGKQIFVNYDGILYPLIQGNETSVVWDFGGVSSNGKIIQIHLLQQAEQTWSVQEFDFSIDIAELSSRLDEITPSTDLIIFDPDAYITIFDRITADINSNVVPLIRWGANTQNGATYILAHSTNDSKTFVSTTSTHIKTLEITRSGYTANSTPLSAEAEIDIISLTITDESPYSRITQDISEGKIPIIRLGDSAELYDQYALTSQTSTGYVFFSSSNNLAKWLTVTESDMTPTTLNLTGGSGDTAIFEAIYGSTTFEEVATALNSGYTILCRKSDNYGNKYYGILSAFRNSGKYVFLSGDDNSQFRFELGADNVWSTSGIITPSGHNRALTIHPADIDSSHGIENTSNANQWKGIGTLLVPTGDVSLSNASIVIMLDSGAGTQPTEFCVGLYKVTDTSTGSLSLVAKSEMMPSGLTVGLNRIPISPVGSETVMDGEGLYYVVLFVRGWGSITPFGKTTTNIGPILICWQGLWTDNIPDGFSPGASWGYSYPFFAMIEA